MHKLARKKELDKDGFQKISVICPVVSENDFLKILDCVSRQTLKDIEILLFPHQSISNKTLNSLKKEFSNEPRIYLANKWLKISEVFEMAMKKAQGKYIFFYNEQDLQPNTFELMYRKANSTKSDIVFCRSQETRERLFPSSSAFNRYDCPLSLFQLMPDIEYCL